MKIKKIISILLIFVFIMNISVYSFATNEISNTQTNEINVNTNSIEDLNNQKSEINNKIDSTTIELEYVKTEI
mgnify:FL=1